MSKQTMREHMNERFGKKNNVLSYYPPLPNSLNIELNNTCNQKCEFCGFHGKYKSWDFVPSRLSFDFVKRILEEAKRLGIGEKEVGFYLSGEVFLYPDFPEVIRYAKNLGFKYTFITTNGAFATPDKAKAVLDAGLDSIRFSVNAADREMYRTIHGTDDFDEVVKNITFIHDYIQDHNLNVATSISCVVTKKQGPNLKDEIKKIFIDKVDDILFIPVILSKLSDMKNAKEEFGINNDENMIINKDYKCPILFNTMYINSDGYVIPCCDAPYSQYYVYDLNKKLDLEEAWYSEGYQRLREIFVDNADDTGTICADCILRYKGVEGLSID
ncbi:radical SAM/SPASM domain-containing protein [Butyrivibrio sp. AE2032]|uniref:radical SAM/SPASM domain-containing protein n=1 Tax=Butyrivibrio sp. AE2032 TaxID=1458463 RepID=UPI00068B4A5B|nr:radical SAM protein [Butyrivibrio sp. AE2032]